MSRNQTDSLTLLVTGDPDRIASLYRMLDAAPATAGDNVHAEIGGRPFRLIEATTSAATLRALANGEFPIDANLMLLDRSRLGAGEVVRLLSLFTLFGHDQIDIAVHHDAGSGDGPELGAQLEGEVARLLAPFGLTARFVISLSGDPAGGGGDALTSVLGHLSPRAPSSGALRMVIESVAGKAEGARVEGKILSGRLATGERLMFSPVNHEASLEALALAGSGEAVREAHAGQNVVLETSQPVAATPGGLVSHLEQLPVETDVCLARLGWLPRALPAPGASYSIVLNGVPQLVTVQSVDQAPGPASGVIEVVLRVPQIVALDPFDANPITGRILVYDDDELVGGGVLSMKGYADQRDLITVRATNLQWVEHRVDGATRAERNGHQGGVMWLTGLSAAGKSTLAIEVEKQLFQRGYQSYVLDGDNIRQGLNANLGFSPEDRSENIRRVGEVAALMARAGMIAVTAFISPYRSDRSRAREAMPDAFHEIYVRCDLATCEQRDPKGLYKKARAGDIAEFTGISAPYEEPEAPELVVDTGAAGIEACVATIVEYVLNNFAFNQD